MKLQQKIDLSKNILKALERKTNIDYCGLYEIEVQTIIFNELQKKGGE